MPVGHSVPFRLPSCWKPQHLSPLCAVTIKKEGRGEKKPSRSAKSKKKKKWRGHSGSLVLQPPELEHHREHLFNLSLQNPLSAIALFILCIYFLGRANVRYFHYCSFVEIYNECSDLRKFEFYWRKLFKLFWWTNNVELLISLFLECLLPYCLILVLLKKLLSFTYNCWRFLRWPKLLELNVLIRFSCSSLKYAYMCVHKKKTKK